MAECAALPSHFNLQVQWRSSNYVNSKSSHSSTMHSLRFLSASSKSPQLLSSKLSKLGSTKNASRCTCLLNLVSSDAVIASDWLPIADQVLLMGSIFLTYNAGVIPTEKPVFTPHKSISSEKTGPETTGVSGSTLASDDQTNSKLVWDVVKVKLVDSLNAIDHLSHFGIQVKAHNEVLKKGTLSLCAIAEGPRLRLLCSCLQRLQEEVDNVSEESKDIDLKSWVKTSGQIIQRSFEPICLTWLEMELSPKNGPNVALSSMMLGKLGNNSILLNIQNSGKEDLFSEFLCFLRFGSVRKGSFYDFSLFMSNGVSILEDMVITLADGIASTYLELISVDRNMSSEMHNLGAVLCTLSTRSLQRLRNEVALNQWLYQNMDAVILMYKDRFDLHTLQKQYTDEPSREQNDIYCWWKNILPGKPDTLSSTLSYVVISDVSMTVKRTNELRALKGWKYYFSLFLELSDITLPMIKTMVAKVSNAMSFFLVSLIGRSLGLIYTGIRQSIRWK